MFTPIPKPAAPKAPASPLKRYSGRVKVAPEHLPRRPGRTATERANAFFAPFDQPEKDEPK